MFEEYTEFVFFYGGPFSQWCPCNLVVDEITYNCAEQYMMAQKARLFNDSLALTIIMSTNDPALQKSTGRSVQGFNEDTWNNVARDIIYRGNYAKFNQNKDLYEELIKTKGKLLVEASKRDKIYGVGLGEFDPRIKDRNNWRGTNWLGEAITKVREDLIKGM